MIVLAIIMFWCFYLRFIVAFLKRNKLLWVEVQDCITNEFSITRIEAKKNLNMVYDTDQKVHTHNNLFDMYWYQYRAASYEDTLTIE